MATVFHITHHKAGSQWIYGILRRLAPGLVVPAKVGVAHFREDPILQGRVYPTIYVPRDEFEKFPLPEDTRCFIVVRDLRDSLVSAYYSFRESHPMLTSQNERQRAILQGKNKAAGYRHLYDGFLPLEARIQSSWLDSGWPIVRYEDLLGNDVEIMQKVLIEDCGMEVEATAVKHAVIANRFDRLSGGRARGEEDLSSHYRKGVVGDWEVELPLEIRQAFEEQYGRLLSQLGYEVGCAQH